MGGDGCVAAVRTGVAKALARQGESPAAWFPWYFPTVAEYVGVLAAAGLEVRLAHLFERPTPVEGEHGLAEWLRLFLAPLVTHLGPRWERFAREAEEACGPALWKDGRWVLDYVRLRIVAGTPA
jgi:hypothetical protein